MNIKLRNIEQSYFLLKRWWESTELTNYEKNILNKEIINFNQQLFKLKEKIIRIGAYGKAGVGKSSILNDILQEQFFNTGILNGSTINHQSKEIILKNNFIQRIELIDFPGFDICNIKKQEKEFINLLSLDLILFITSGDLNRSELKNLLFLLKQGKNVIIIINKIDIFKREEIQIIKNKIIEKLPINCKIPIITNSIKNNNLSNKNKINIYLNETLKRIGHILLIANTYQIANKLALNIKENRLIKRKQKAQSLIGKVATIKASSVAINPIFFIDIAGTTAIDTLLIKELCKIYGLQIKGKSVTKLLKSLSFNNLCLGLTQIGINSSFNFIKKISLIFAPLTSGLSLFPYGTIAVVQAALAVHTTKLIGRLAAKEILEKSKTNNLEPFKKIQNLILEEQEIICSNKYFLYNQSNIDDYSIYIP